MPLERHLRQLTLDLLGRPPTLEEYQAAQARGRVDVEDIRALMAKEEFYARMRGYHRALVRSNISASVLNNGNSRTVGAGTVGNPLGLRGNSATALRGVNGSACDGYIEQARCNQAGTEQQDPHLEPALASKRCVDDYGVPLPVSVDYDTNFYRCTQLDTKEAPIATCEAALAKTPGNEKYLYFCDMRRVSTDSNKLHPFLCVPDPDKNTTGGLTKEEADGAGKVTAFVHPSPPAGASLTRLNRCTLNLNLRNNLNGSYVPVTGCIQREGYAMVPTPYWLTSPAQVAVCAIEAQSRAVNPATLEPCETARFASDRSCGCGERMRRCEAPTATQAPTGLTHEARVAAFNEEPERIADSVLRADEPYFNILTTRRSFLNGTLSEFYKQNQGVGVFTVSPPAELDALPAIPFAEAATWSEYTRGPQHSGILTTPAFLLRFPTYRARVSEFYEAFLCKTFVPAPGDSLPPPEDACNRENNLAKRCGCNYCHATIEPTGAHWGRFGERVAQYMSAEQFPRFDAKCRDCAIAGDTNCGGECGQYVMQAYDGDGASSLGMLKTYLYRTADEEPNIEGGPRVLVQRMMQTGDLERCTVKRMWNEFLGRPMSAEEQRLYLQPLADGFTRDGHRLKALIERVLMTDAYRRID
ncbi:DUF1585 domain-containing protein [Myxococcaceae bacterium GXIMD 01537]